MVRHLISAIIATALCMGSAAAQQPTQEATRTGSKEDATFKALDRDADQRLSKSEAASDETLADQFANVDANSDGYLTKREYTAHMKSMKESSKKDY